MLLDFYKQLTIKFLRLKSDFLLIFFKNEYQALAGNSNNRIKPLFGIILLTLIALSFAIGSIHYLKVKMDNPFTNWVDMPVRYEYQDKVQGIDSYFSDSQTAEKYGLKSITEYSKFSPEIYHFETNERLRVLGMTFDPSGDLIKRVLENVPNSSNIFTEDGVTLKDDFLSGVVVTEKMLTWLGCEEVNNQRMIVFDDENYRRYIPIIGVVKSLPSLSDFACTPRLYNWMSESWDETKCIESKGKINYFYIVSNISNTDYFQGIFEEHNLNYSIEKEIFVDNIKNSNSKYRINLGSWQTLEEREVSFQNMRELLGKDASTTYWLPDWKCSAVAGIDRLDNPYYLAFNFSELDNIRKFKETMQSNFDVEISMNQVESKENFMVISRLTFIISIMLFFFVLCSILFYVRNLLVSHLEKNKPNLGTFKAFGLDNKTLVNNYRNIIFSFISFSVLLAFLLTWIIERIEQFINQEDSVLILFSGWIFLAISLLFIVVYFAIGKITMGMLKHTPGDLIYNRV